METLWQDMRYALRTLRKGRGVTLLAVLALSISIGANTAIFSVVSAVILRPLAYRDPDRLMTVWESASRRGQRQVLVSIPNFRDWKEQNTVFEDMAFFTDLDLHIQTDQGAAWVYSGEMTANLLPLLGVQPLLGRGFLQEEEDRGEPVILLSHGFWQRMFGGDPDMIGKPLLTSGRSYTIVGVLPPEFRLAYQTRVPEVWIVFDAAAARSGSDFHQRGTRLNRALARLKPGVTVEQASQAMNAIAERLAQQYPDSNAGFGVTVIPLHDQLAGPVRPALLVLLGAIAFVLLIACANVASLLLARASGRRREIAVRLSLGADRRRIIRQLLTESVILALLAGAVGLALAFWGAGTLVALAPAEIPRLDEVRLDWRVLVFTVAVACVAGIVFGLAPALSASRTDLNASLKEGGRGAAGLRRRLGHRALAVFEVAVSLVLLVGAGLLMKSFARLTAVDPGFETDKTAVAYVGLPEFRYRERHQQARFYQQLLERVEGLPGVEAAGVIFPAVLGDRVSNRFTIEGRQPADPNERLAAYFRSVSPDYFRVMGIRLLRGRFFSGRDISTAAPVVIINETMVRRWWPNEDPIGQRITITVRFHSGQDVPREIVGVVADVRHAGLDQPSGPEMYTSYLQVPWPWMSLVVRSASDRGALAAAVRAETGALDRSVPVNALRPLEEVVAESVAPRKFNAMLVTLFAAAALLLAAIGIYSVLSYLVSQRTHEMGIRTAMGARPRDILRLVLGEGMVLAGMGTVIGIVGAWWLTRYLQTLLFAVPPTDLATFGIVAAFLLAVALAACYFPARRAMRVDPLTALRYE